MKPTEFFAQAREDIARDLLATPNFALLSGFGQAHASVTAIGWYLDEEYERRQAFERNVLERLAKLEEQERIAGVIGRTEHGDRVYGLRRYEPEAVEPEPESES